MKSICCIMTIGVVSLLMGCASTQVSLPPVGPNPERAGTKSSTGDLQVFSSLVGRAEGENPTWHQHSDYYIYDPGRESGEACEQHHRVLCARAPSGITACGKLPRQGPVDGLFLG